MLLNNHKNKLGSLRLIWNNFPSVESKIHSIYCFSLIRKDIKQNKINETGPKVWLMTEKLCQIATFNLIDFRIMRKIRKNVEI